MEQLEIGFTNVPCIGQIEYLGDLLLWQTKVSMYNGEQSIENNLEIVTKLVDHGKTNTGM